MATRVHSLADWRVNFGSVEVTEWTDGDAISASLDDDDLAVTQGHNGAVVFAWKPGSLATVELTVMAGSPVDLLLHELVEERRLARRGSIPFSAIDGRGHADGGTEIIIPQSNCKKRPDITAGTEAGTVVWMITGAASTWKLGMNELA